MTTSPTQPNPIQPRKAKPVVVECLPAPARQSLSIAIRWQIARQTIADHTPTPIGDTHTIILELAATQSAGAFESSWTLIDPTTNAQCALNLPALSNSSCDRISTDAHDHNLLILNTHHTQAIIKRTSDLADTLLFVRTSLFGTLNIPGGRYKPLVAQVLDPRA